MRLIMSADDTVVIKFFRKIIIYRLKSLGTSRRQQLIILMSHARVDFQKKHSTFFSKWVQETLN